jgi:hypothetical protein
MCLLLLLLHAAVPGGNASAEAVWGGSGMEVGREFAVKLPKTYGSLPAAEREGLSPYQYHLIASMRNRLEHQALSSIA